MPVEADGIQKTGEGKASRSHRWLVITILLTTVLGVVSLIFLNLYLDYQSYSDSKTFRNYFGGRFLGETCIYQVSQGLVGFPIQIEADVEFIDKDTIKVSSPIGCKDKFEFIAEIGDFYKPVTQVFTPYGEIPEDASKILREGYPNVTAYSIGDKDARKYGLEDSKVTERGKLLDLFESKKVYSPKNALLSFYRFDRVYYNDDKIYVTEVFFNEK